MTMDWEPLKVTRRKSQVEKEQEPDLKEDWKEVDKMELRIILKMENKQLFNMLK